MPRTLAPRLLALLLGVAISLPAHPVRAAVWSTWIKMVTTNDMIALRDTVWLATGEAGILRYLRTEDRFESVTREPGGLASNNVTAMVFDRSGRLWAGTAGRGVSRLSATGAGWDLVNAFDGLPSDSVTVLRAAGDTVWIGTTRGIALWNGHQIAGSVPDIGTASPFTSNVVTGIVVRGDTLFVATLDGLWQARLTQNLAAWSRADSGIAVRAIDGLISDGDWLFAISGGVIYEWNKDNGVWGALTSTDVSGHMDKLRDDFGTLLAVSPWGLFRWDGAQWNVVANARGSGSGASTSEFGADPTGKIFNTHAQVLLEQAGDAWISHTPPGPVNNDVQNVLHDGARLWAATFNGGVSRFDGTTWRNFPSGCCGLGQDTSFVNPAYAFTLQQDDSGYVWTSAWSTAIERVDASTNPMHVVHAFVVPGDGNSHSWGWSSAVDSWGDVYIGGDTPSRGTLEPMGIDVYDKHANRVVNWTARTTGMAGNQVRAIAVDRSRVLWAGFAGAGVSWALLDSTDSDHSVAGNDHLKLPTFHAVSSLASSDIFGVVAHGDSIWVLTTTDLKRLRSTTRFVSSSYEIPAGPAPRGAVHPLAVAPDGTVWVGSVDGVRRYMPGGGSEDYRTDNSPLADNEVRSVYVEKATGAVWIATAAGVNRFDPFFTAAVSPTITSLSLKLYPNPASLNAMGLELHLDASTPGLVGTAIALAGDVIDLSGRSVSRFAGIASGGVVWNGRDSNGTLVRPGVYFVHARGGGREAVVRVVVLR